MVKIKGNLPLLLQNVQRLKTKTLLTEIPSFLTLKGEWREDYKGIGFISTIRYSIKEDRLTLYTFSAFDVSAAALN